MNRFFCNPMWLLCMLDHQIAAQQRGGCSIAILLSSRTGLVQQTAEEFHFYTLAVWPCDAPTKCQKVLGLLLLADEAQVAICDATNSTNERRDYLVSDVPSYTSVHTLTSIPLFHFLSQSSCRSLLTL